MVFILAHALFSIKFVWVWLISWQVYYILWAWVWNGRFMPISNILYTHMLIVYMLIALVLLWWCMNLSWLLKSTSWFVLIGRALRLEVCHLLLRSTWLKVKMLSQALTLRMIMNPLGWMKRMKSQPTKSELLGRSIPLLPLKHFVWNHLLSYVCKFPCVEWFLCQLWGLQYP